MSVDLVTGWSQQVGKYGYDGTQNGGGGLGVVGAIQKDGHLDEREMTSIG